MTRYVNVRIEIEGIPQIYELNYPTDLLPDKIISLPTMLEQITCEAGRRGRESFLTILPKEHGGLDL